MKTCLSGDRRCMPISGLVEWRSSQGHKSDREEIGMNALCRRRFIIQKWTRKDDVKLHRHGSTASRPSERENLLREALLVAIATTMASTSLCLPCACTAHATTALASCPTSSTPSAFFRPSISFFGHAVETQLQRCNSRRAGWRRPGPVIVRAEEVKEKTRPIGLSRETGGQWLSCTTRHIRIYAGYVDPETKVMDQSQLDKLTLMLDPDNEFVWPEDAVQKVFDQFRELVETYAVRFLNLTYSFKFRIIHRVPTACLSSVHFFWNFYFPRCLIFTKYCRVLSLEYEWNSARSLPSEYWSNCAQFTPHRGFETAVQGRPEDSTLRCRNSLIFRVCTIRTPEIKFSKTLV